MLFDNVPLFCSDAVELTDEQKEALETEKSFFSQLPEQKKIRYQMLQNMVRQSFFYILCLVQTLFGLEIVYVNVRPLTCKLILKITEVSLSCSFFIFNSSLKTHEMALLCMGHRVKMTEYDLSITKVVFEQILKMGQIKGAPLPYKG